ncbi:MAG: hypothetical protein KC492_21795, partial [Myxococcales bacterium]|nr:hypothetical protein [Myxococcales bacterium]
MPTIEVFEHQKLKVGAQFPTREGGTFELTSQHIDALNQYNSRQRITYFDSGYRSLRTRHYVGFVQVGKLSIEILPKADRDYATRTETAAWRALLIDMLNVAGLTLKAHDDAAQAIQRGTLLELIARSFLTALERLLHEGLAKGYRTHESNGSVFRGRLLIADNIRENAARPDRFYVRYQQFDHDTPLNRILALALDVLLELPLSATLVNKARALRAWLPPLTPSYTADFDRVKPSRNTERYRAALIFAELILKQQSPALRGGSTQVFALLFDLNQLWEAYIATLLRSVAPPELRVATQHVCKFWGGHVVRTVRPDLVIWRGDTVQWIGDTKWRVPDHTGPKDNELKQMFVYNELLKAKRSLLIYPAGKRGRKDPVESSFFVRDHSCGVATLDI